MSDLVLDINSIVTIKEGDHNFKDCQGVVMDMASDLNTEEGPIAVFFDTEVSLYCLLDGKQFNTPPTPENYKDCPRIICFKHEEVEVADEFSLETRAKRLYPHGYWGIQSWKFPLVRDSHECQFDDCENTSLATEKTLVNIWGTICEVYTCSECHEKRDGVFGEILGLKDPLPGFTQESRHI